MLWSLCDTAQGVKADKGTPLPPHVPVCVPAQ